jgi:hypothetical protein
MSRRAELFDPLASFDAIEQDELNRCLTEWGHRMGPLNRPTPSRAHGLRHDGKLVAVTATDHLAAANVAGLRRDQAVELSRVCAERPHLCRVVLRLWREFVFPAMTQARGVEWAISYQDAALHSGDLYRFDGWVKLAFSHSGTDTRTGRPGRDKFVWGWHADPKTRRATAKAVEAA